MQWVESMDGQHLARCCLPLPLLFLHLGTAFPLITMLGFHVGFHATMLDVIKPSAQQVRPIL